MVEGSLVVRLLGDLEVVRGGDSVALPRSRRTRALLGFLVASGKAERRERLCDLLWDGPDDPRAALRWSLTKLRPLVDAPGRSRIISDRERAGFDTRDTYVDTTVFRTALTPRLEVATTAALQQAIDLVRGDFLVGLDLPQCYSWNAWLAGQRDEFRQLQRSALAALVMRLHDRPAEALIAARRRAVLDPFAEDAHATVIELLGSLGRVREMRAEYEACVRLMRQEFQRRPSERLEAARRRAEEACRAVPVDDSQSSAPSDSSMELTDDRHLRLIRPRARAPQLGPMVGRTGEMERLSAVAGIAPPVDVAEGPGGPRCLLVSGEPGIGKSRLLEELAALAAEHDVVVLRGRAYEAEMIRPYGPWTDALRPVVSEMRTARQQPAALARVLAHLGALLDDSQAGRSDGDAAGQHSGSVEGGGSPHRQNLFDAVVELLQLLGRAGRTPLIVLDDLQWFDDASIALLHYVMRVASQSLLLAASARVAALAANPAASGLVRTLRRDGRLEEIRLGPLPAADIAQLIRGFAPEADVSRVAASADGNPLFAIEIARNLSIGKSILPASLDAVIEDHLARLDELTRELVPWAAAFGTSFDPELLGNVSGVSDAELDAAMHELELNDVIRQAPGTVEYDFTHDLVRQIAYRQLTPLRARTIHRTIAAHLAELDDSSGERAGDLARHAQLGGNNIVAARACLRAGARCLRLFALHDARITTELGLELLAASSIPKDERLALQGELFRVLVHAGGGRREPDLLHRRLEEFTEEARVAGNPALVQTGYSLTALIHFQGEDLTDVATDILRAVDAGRAGDEETAVRSMANTGRCLATIERELPRAAELLHHARQGAQSLQLELLDICWGDGVMAQFQGDDATAIRELTRVVDLGRSQGEPWPVCDALLRLACIEFERGDYAAALGWCGELAPVTTRLGEASDGPLGEAVGALSRLAKSPAGAERVAAETQFSDAIDALAQLDAKGARGYALLLRSRIALTEGDVEGAHRNATAALEAATAVGRQSLSSRIRLVLATLALGSESWDVAHEMLRSVSETAQQPLALSALAHNEFDALRARIPTTAPTLLATLRVHP